MNISLLIITLTLLLQTTAIPTAEARKPVVCRMQQTNCRWIHPKNPQMKNPSILRCKQVRVCR